jgi:KaiC/GvpD/RAD55 family RecA-like ATPase/5S rRNA maturation endonuclease (ribonuclease M5)
MAIDILPYFNERKISKSTLDAYGVKGFHNEGTTEVAVGFPLVDASGQVGCYHFRKVDMQAGALTRDMYYEKGSRIKCPLFGWQLVSKQTKVLYICEGETDTLALATQLAGDKTKAVVGVVGTGFAEKVGSWLAARASSMEVVLLLDNDTAGLEARQRISDKLRTKEITCYSIDFEGKDVGDAIKAGVDFTQASLKPLLSTIFMDNVEVGIQFRENIRLIRDQQIFKVEFSKTLARGLMFPPGNIGAIIGTSGCGKSTLAEHILLDALKPKLPAAMISAEMSAEEVGRKLLSTLTAEDYCSNDRYTDATDEELDEAQDLITKVCKRFFITDNESYTMDTIERNLYELIASGNAPRLVVVDHILAVSPGIQTLDLEETCKRLKAIARSCNTFILVISHIRKPPAGANPQTYHPHSSDAFNSDALARYANWMLGVSLNRESNRMRVSTIKVDRMGGGHKFFDVEFVLKNWQLHEVVETQTPEPLPMVDEDFSDY